MPITPVKLKEVLGEDGLQELHLLIGEKSIEGQQEVVTRLDIIEHDLSDLKTEFREFRRETYERFDRINERFDTFQKDSNERFDKFQKDINNKFDSNQKDFNQRFDSINERFDSIQKDFNQRFDNINERFDSIQKDFNQRFDNINERFDNMHQHMATMVKWTVGTLAFFGTLITIFIAIGQFFK